MALTVDGADEVDPNLNLIKGYGRALVREKIVAASSRQGIWITTFIGDSAVMANDGTATAASGATTKVARRSSVSGRVIRA